MERTSRERIPNHRVDNGGGGGRCRHSSRTVINVDELSWGGDLGEVFLTTRTLVGIFLPPGHIAYIVQPKKFVITALAELVVGGDSEFMTSLDGDLESFQGEAWKDDGE